MVDEYIKKLSEILKISVPKISYTDESFTSKSMIAQADLKNNTIYLKSKRPSPDLMFAIAHEMRHFWQWQNDKDLYFNDYKPRHLFDTVEAYNLQIAEIDANAFSVLIMVNFFNVKPLFEGLPDSVKQRIFERVDLILQTEFS